MTTLPEITRLGSPARLLLALAFGMIAGLLPAPLFGSVSGLGPDGKFYEVVLYTDGTTLTWDQARDEALAAIDGGSRLAEIDSEEIDLLVERLRQQALGDAGIDPASTSAPPLWVGGWQQAGQTRPFNGWVWDSDSRALPGEAAQTGYSNWLGDEPNDWPSAPEDGEEDYVAIGFQGQFGWNDRTAPCTGYVRQYDVASINFDTGPQVNASGSALHYIQGPFCLDYEEAAYCARRLVEVNTHVGLRVGQLAQLPFTTQFYYLDSMMEAHVLPGWDTSPSIGPFWLGARQSDAAPAIDAGWTWLDGTPVGTPSYDRWATGQPDDAPGAGVEDGEQNRLVMDSGEWVDWSGVDQLSAMLVEYHEPPPHRLVRRSTRYDGASAMRAAHQPGFTRNVEMCIEAWIYRDQSGPQFQTILSQGFSSSFWFGLNGDKLRFYRSSAPGALNAADSLTGKVPLCQWTHVAVSYDGSFARFYINGQSAGERALANSGTGTTDDLLLGRDPGASPFFLHAYLDEVRLWSTTRDGLAIRADMSRELTSAVGLEQVWPEGGIDFIPGSSGGGGTPTSERLGILPKDLVVPAARTPPTFDGDVDIDTEYSGAEQVILRYADEAGTAKDAIAYLVHTKDYLYIGVRGARQPASGLPSASNAFSVLADGDGATTDFEPGLVQGRVFLEDGTDAALRVKTVTVGAITTNVWSATPAPGPHQLQSRQGELVRDEFASPDMEFRLHRDLLGGFDYTSHDRLALSHHDNGGSTGDRWFPDGATDSTPASWVEVRYFPVPDPGIPLLSAFGTVVDPSTGDGVPGVPVSVVANTNLATTTSSVDGTWSFSDVALPEGIGFKIAVTPPPFARTEIAAAAEPTNLQPTSLHPVEVSFPPCDVSPCRTANLTFYIQEPVAAATLTRATQVGVAPGGTPDWTDPLHQTWPPVLVRSGASPRRVAPSLLWVEGTNLHDALEFYFASTHCPNELEGNPTCTEGDHYFRAASETFVPAAGGVPAHYLVETPDIPELRYGFKRLAAHDTWPRPGNAPLDASSWEYLPDQIAIVQPPYQLIHAFPFENTKDGHDFDDYRAAFFDQICDPFYQVGTLIFFPVYLSILGDGECVGLAVTAQQYARGTRNIDAINGDVLYGKGFPSLLADPRDPGANEQPVLPAVFGNTNPCSPAPFNIWAQIKANHGVQLSSDYVGATLGQFSFAAGPDRINLRDQIEKIRGEELEWIMCIRDGEKGHCVQPLRVIDVSDDIKQVEVWDNNHPDEVRTVNFDLRGPHRYLYDGGFEGGPWNENWVFMYHVDTLYDGVRRVPSADSVGAALSEFGVTHLWELLQLIVSGDAEPMITAGDGSRAGWDADGTFSESGTGIASIPNFNWIPGESPPLGHHPMSFHVRTDAGAPLAEIHNRGEAYKIHASHHGTMFQFFVSDGIVDEIDLMTDIIVAVPTDDGGTTNRVAGTCFEAGNGGRDVEVRIALCQNATSYPAAVTMEAIRVQAGGQAMLQTHLDGTGFTFTNNTGGGVDPNFNIIVPGPAGTGPVVRDTPDLFIPDKAVLTVESPDGSDYGNLLFLLDENGDGAFELSLQYIAATGDFAPYVPPAAPYLLIGIAGAPATVTLVHPLEPQAWELQRSTDLVDWVPVDLQEADVTVVGEELHVTLPKLAGRHFFRYARREEKDPAPRER